jgi:hypothetical protein
MVTPSSRINRTSIRVKIQVSTGKAVLITARARSKDNSAICLLAEHNFVVGFPLTFMTGKGFHYDARDVILSVFIESTDKTNLETIFEA